MLHGKWLLAVWLLGVTVVGAPFVLVLDFLKGVLIGFSLGVLVQAYGWKGMLFALAAMVPGNLLVLPALLFASVSSVAFALHVFRYRLMQPSGSLREPLLAHTSAALTMLAVSDRRRVHRSLRRAESDRLGGAAACILTSHHGRAGRFDFRSNLLL